MTKRKDTWRICPKCRGRATKMFSLDTGVFHCQQCEHEYEWPKPDKEENRNDN
jgi:ribosomal protein L37AE/L43A